MWVGKRLKKEEKVRGKRQIRKVEGDRLTIKGKRLTRACLGPLFPFLFVMERMLAGARGPILS